MSIEPIPIKRKSRSVSTFLKKTYQILQDPENSYAIRWSNTGVGFIVVKEELFSKDILPRYFKHSNYSSFVRQLNMYNFHKIRQSNNQSHFHHQFFCQNNKNLLNQIKRKPQKKKRKPEQQYSDDENQIVNQIYNDRSDISLKNNIKNNSYKCEKEKENCFKNFQKNFTEKKLIEDTCHKLCSEKQNQGNAVSKKNQNFEYESKERVSIQNILNGNSEIEEDKLSINNELAEGFPRYPTKQIFYPSNNNIYPFPVNHKVGNIVSHFSIFF